ncbi:TIM-barrel domain-containing protein [Octadecabacter temperatus]|uniref:TIM-barrel domain-containing protein n=1 Tax=Octadecabacter temperatus TaxID=1458307 RepID=UPI001F1A985E|nr:TIM-barrel domain-containing protein [Octadecabacter temperatus]
MSLKISQHEIPCDSFQLSSGYTSIGTKRHVFNWNQDKVPDIMALAGKFHDAQVHLVANIKPCLLHDHSRIYEAVTAGLLIKESETGALEQSTFWDDTGSHLGFTNADTMDFLAQAPIPSSSCVGCKTGFSIRGSPSIHGTMTRP